MPDPDFVDHFIQASVDPVDHFFLRASVGPLADSWRYSSEARRERPRRLNCDRCGNYWATADEFTGEPPTTCASCEDRRADALRHIANGGRRFGVEIEVEWEGGGYDRDYDDDCDCNCDECRPRRDDVPSASTIAAAITRAGVPCIDIGYTHEVQHNTWKVVSDGSLSYGWEIVSPPLQWAQADQIRKVCEVLSELGAYPSEACGLHVHHDVGEIDLAGMRSLVNCWSDWQTHTDRICADYRQSSDWCLAYGSRALHQVASANNLTDLVQRMDRYMSLNVQCFGQYGTVEARQHQATLDPEEILAWVAYGQAIVNAALDPDRKPPPSDDTAEFVDGLPIPEYTPPAPTLFDNANVLRDRLKEKADRGRSRPPRSRYSYSRDYD